MRCHRGLAAMAVALVLQLAPAPARAQYVRGVVRDSSSGDVIDEVMVTLLDSTARLVTAVRSARGGRFVLRGAGSAHYALDARRLGYAPSTSGWFAAGSGDTLEVTIRMSRLPIQLAAVTVTEEREALINTVQLFGLNLRSLPARNLITPSQVEASRGSARDYIDLIQSQHVVGITVWEYDTRRGLRCVANTRPPGGCLLVVVDGVRLSDQSAIDVAVPSLIEFAVIIPANEAGVLYGTSGQAGVLYISTRAGGKH